MGFLDKLKASVGIGGAKIELDAPCIAVSGSKIPVRVRVRGGKIQQQLNGVEMSLEVWPDDSAGKDDERAAKGPRVSDAGVVAGSAHQAIPPDGEQVYEGEIEVPSCQSLYEAFPDRYASLVIPTDEEDDDAAWNSDGPLPFVSLWESHKLYLLASADIPGAIDPTAKSQVHVIPEAAGVLHRVASITSEDLGKRLRLLGAVRVFVSNASDNWFVWWARAGGYVVGYSPLQMICSVRPDGVMRATDNPNIPLPSQFPRQPNEPTPPALFDPTDLEPARAYAEAVIAAGTTGAVLLPRPITNSWAALTGLVLARSS